MCWPCSATPSPRKASSPSPPYPTWPGRRPPAPLLILDRLRDPGNAGTLLRTAEATGVAGVVFGPETVDPYNDKVLRAGMGAHFRVPLRVADDWAEIDAWLAPDQPVYLAEAAATLAYDEIDWRGPAALVVGGEADGAGDDARRRATPLAIPMAGRVESLNAAVAGAVILIRGRASTPNVKENCGLSGAALTGFWHRCIMAAAGFTINKPPAAAAPLPEVARA